MSNIQTLRSKVAKGYKNAGKAKKARQIDEMQEYLGQEDALMDTMKTLTGIVDKKSNYQRRQQKQKKQFWGKAVPIGSDQSAAVKKLVQGKEIEDWVKTEGAKPEADRASTFAKITKALEEIGRKMPSSGVAGQKFWSQIAYAFDYLLNSGVPLFLIKKTFLNAVSHDPTQLTALYKAFGASLGNMAYVTKPIYPQIPVTSTEQVIRSTLRRMASGSQYRPAKFDNKVARIKALNQLYKNERDVKPGDYLKKTGVTQGYLSLYPHWAVKEMKKTQTMAQKMLDRNSKVQQLNNKKSLYWTQLAKLGEVKYNQRDKKWQGKQVDAFLKKHQAQTIGLKKRVTKNTKYLGKALTQEQIQQQVPQFIRQLVSANKTLSDVGFGPISKNSSDLFAGRWIDRTTGKIRVLPTADAKWINPTSLPQKLGYLQAKVLNHWNNCLSAYDQYLELKKKNPDLVQATAKKVANAGNTDGVNIGFANFIRNTILTFTKQQALGMPITAKRYLLNQIGIEKLEKIYSMEPKDKIDDDQPNRNNEQLNSSIKKKITAWTNALQSQYNASLLALESDGALNQTERIDAQTKLSNAYLGMINYSARKTASLINTLKRTAIPVNLTYKWINQNIQDFEQAQKASKKLLKTVTGQGLDPNIIDQISDLGTQGAQLIRGKLFDKDPDQRQKAQETLMDSTKMILDNLPQTSTQMPQYFYQTIKKKTPTDYYGPYYKSVGAVNPYKKNLQSRMQEQPR